MKQADEVIGNRVKIKVVKNKVAAPFRLAEFDIMFNSGVSRVGDLLDLAVAKNIVAKTGAWFSYKEERLGQGRENSKEFLEQNPKLTAEIEKLVLTAYGIGPEAEAAAAAAEAAADAAAAAESKAGDRAGAVAAESDEKKAVKAPQPVAAATKVKKTASK